MYQKRSGDYRNQLMGRKSLESRNGHRVDKASIGESQRRNLGKRAEGTLLHRGKKIRCAACWRRS